MDPKECRRFFMEMLYEIVHQKSEGRKKFLLDEYNSKTIELICQYANREPEFEKSGEYSFSKGLYIYGTFGSGKTIIIQAYMKFKREVLKQKIGFKTCAQMNADYRFHDQWTDDIMRWNAPTIKMFTNINDTEVERIFDDLGEEETIINDYGTKICVMGYLLGERYKIAQKGGKTHITSNLSPERIAEFYGGRLESRIFEMFNVICLGGKNSTDFRKI